MITGSRYVEMFIVLSIINSQNTTINLIYITKLVQNLQEIIGKVMLTFMKA